MGLAVSYRVPVNGSHQAYPVPRIIKAILIQNLSGDFLNFDNGTDPVVRITSGATQGVLFQSSSVQMTLWTDSATSGEAWVYAYDSPTDISSNPNMYPRVTITNASLNINGTVTATISGPVTVSGAVDAHITNASIAVTGPIDANITNAVITAKDIIVENNTGVLTGLLPATTVQFNVFSGNVNSTTITKAIAGFGLTATITGAGRLNVWVSQGGNTEYLVRDRGFYGSPLTRNPIEKRFNIPIAVNDVINVSWDDAITLAAFVLRY